MELRETHVACDLRQSRLPLELAFDELDGARHAREIAAVDEAVSKVVGGRFGFHVHDRILQTRAATGDPILAAY
jgi:hypothetical protein